MDKVKIMVLVFILLLTSIYIDNIDNMDILDIIKGNTINPDSVEYYDIAAANNAFAFDMYSRLAQMEAGKKKNIVFSPHSISAAMAICYEGAENTTKEQISNAFYFPDNKTVLKVRFKEMNDGINSDTGKCELETANALWVQEGSPVKKEYVSNVKNYYDGKATNLDFAGRPDASRKTINKWVEDKTHDGIKDPVQKGSITEDTRLIITNAIYFEGKWEHKFDEEMTGKKAFYPAEGEEISAYMMYISKNFNYSENSKAKIIELPYKGSSISMYIVLPKENNIKEFENNFTLNEYTELKNNMNSTEKVRTSIPKFKFGTEAELSTSLIEMGVLDAFDPNRANFSGISDEPLAISRVIHKTFIDVQEKGTKAFSVTMFGVYGSAPIPREFTANHPFMFFIEDRRTNCILFMGKVEYPEY